MSTIYIYTLSCPDTGLVKYVGKTNNVTLRYNQHTSDRRKMSKVKSWIKSLKTKGRLPIMEVIEECDSTDWRLREEYWIYQLRAWGFDLKNTQNGGMGNDYISTETREKISKTLMGKKLTWSVRDVLGKKICQYDLDGNYVSQYETILDAEKMHGYFTNNIISSIKRSQSAYGFQWRYLTDIFYDKIAPYVRNWCDPKAASDSRKIPVLEIDSKNNTITEFSSIKDAEDATGLFNIGAVCRGVRPHSRGRQFIFKKAIDASTIKP